MKSSSSPPGVKAEATATAGKGDEGEEDIVGKSDKAPDAERQITEQEKNAAYPGQV